MNFISILFIIIGAAAVLFVLLGVLACAVISGEESRKERPDCKWYRAGKCIHFERRKYCHPSDFKWFDYAKPLHAVWCDRVCELENPDTQAMYRITEEDIEALRNGKVLTIVSPSPFFIAYMEDTPDE